MTSTFYHAALHAQSPKHLEHISGLQEMLAADSAVAWDENDADDDGGMLDL